MNDEQQESKEIVRSAETLPAPLSSESQSLPSSESQSLSPSEGYSLYFADFAGVDVPPLVVASKLNSARVKHAGVSFRRGANEEPLIRVTFVGEPTEDQRDALDRAMRDAFVVTAKHHGVAEPIRELRRRSLWAREATAPKRV